MSNDSKLQQAVLDELAWEPSVAAGHVGVTAEDGVVTLTGHVSSFAEKSTAEAAARRVKGVRAVIEHIKIKLKGDVRITDDEIAASAAARLSEDVHVPKDSVQVVVEEGWITLNGEVAWNYQKEAAEQCVWRLPAIVGVTNLITIKPAVDVFNIRDDITHALNRSWFFDPQTIEVRAEGGQVRLSGTVQSLHERQIAAATAWRAPGVTEVLNDLVVV
ncbi:BON domain-containing protein [Labrys sp. LIt4]|uniref:BON domain-containing protein n=1 Tax=Labrys sp. LIt4 TaxID=2821355 RepID=UPI001ADF212A|nr:BON domain-containing protein [Labrys sp. LIt4]MBP0580424.1 BON domain-containing protein [Labrys sp. LIt4]